MFGSPQGGGKADGLRGLSKPQGRRHFAISGVELIQLANPQARASE